MKQLEVLSIKKNIIKNVNIKLENKKSLIVCLCNICFIFMFSFGLFAFNNTEIANVCVQVFNPINSLYNNSNNIIFTSNSNNNFVNTKNLKLIVPIISSQVKNNITELRFLIDNSIMVKACEDGVVSNMGVLPNGEKFIEISHNAQVITRYSNIDITGVVINELVKKGKDIATAKQNSYVNLSVFIDGVAQNISISKNYIIWEN